MSSRFLPGNFGSASPIIKFAVSAIAFSAIAIFLAYFAMLRMRYRTYRLSKKYARLNDIIDAHLLEHVFTMDEEGEDVSGAIAPDHVHAVLYNRPFQKRSSKQVLVDRLIFYKKNISGRMGDQITELFLLLDLDKFCVRKLEARSVEKVIQGLNEVTEMQVPVSDTLLLLLTNSRNRDVRAAARRAYIKLSNNEPFKFFDIATEHLLVWDQVELFSVISSTPGLAIPNFARWIIYSPNKGVVSFCLRLIVHFNQLAAIQSVIKLLNTRDHELRSEAINALGKLKAEEAEDKLISIYESQPRSCQVEILKALGRISSGRHLDFLKHEFMHSSSFDIRKLAAKSLIDNEWKAEEMIEDLLNGVNGESQLILKHCMNPLIKF
jgi:HEAT repeat protein